MAKKGWDNPIKGELSPHAKLTDEAVRHIRTSDDTAYALARAYKVSHAAVRYARERVTWQHVE